MSSIADTLFDQVRRKEEAGDWAGVEETCRKILSRFPYHARATASLGAVCAMSNRIAEARDLLTQAARLAPSDSDVQERSARAMVHLGELGAALQILQRLLGAQPRHFSAWNLAAQCLARVGDNKRAIECLSNAVAITPTAFDPWLNLANLHLNERRISDAWDCCRKALELAPERADVLGLSGDIQSRRGFAKEAVDYYRAALRLRPDYGVIHCNMLLLLNYLPDLTTAQLYREHLAWAASFADPLSAIADRPDNDGDAERVLRIGYVLSDLTRQAVTAFFAPLLRHHDRSRFAIYGYASLGKQDELSRELAPLFLEVRDTGGVSDEALCTMVRSDRIDILVDLYGHTSDHRLLAFARKPAPIQVNSVSYPNTTGMKAMDYRFTDDIADPEGEEICHSEELLRLAPGFCCYAPVAGVSIRPLPAASKGYITFGATHTLQKLNSQVIDLYAEVLHAVPSSRILLFRSTLSPSQQGQFREEFRSRGIESSRVEMGFKLPEGGHPLNAYDGMDLHLDSFPWNGHTTTCDALWMGVPTLTLKGTRHASRMGASVLHRVGLDNFAAADRADFVRIAVEWAGKIWELAALRMGLRERMRQSPLCDGAGYARAVEGEYRKMWQKWCASRSR